MIESRDPGLLIPELQDKLEALSSFCENHGFQLGIGTTLRGPVAQAKMWCRSRTQYDVFRTHDNLVHSAPKIANLLKGEYASLGPQITAHLPCQSWHQLGEAVDVYANVRGSAVWEGSMAHVLMRGCQALGLYHSLNEKQWEPKSRHWHVQLRRSETPFMVRGLFDSWAIAEEEIEKRFTLE